MNFFIVSHPHAFAVTPASEVLSLLYAQIPRIGFFSSLVHSISHFWPVDCNEFLLTRTITPSERRILVRTFSFQSDSYASLTDISTYSNGEAVRSDCPFRKSLFVSSSIANAMNTTFLVAMFNCFWLKNDLWGLKGNASAAA